MKLLLLTALMVVLLVVSVTAAPNCEDGYYGPNCDWGGGRGGGR